MKKILLVVLSFLSMFSLSACKDKKTSDEPDTKTTIEEETVTLPTESDPTEPQHEGLCIYMPEGRGLKVLQLADIHFGIEGKDWHNDKVDRTKEYINNLIAEEKPDFIVCSGDNILSTGINGLSQFVEMMESYQIPWTWVYGNHDAETKNKKEYSDFLLNCVATGKTKYLLYQEE